MSNCAVRTQSRLCIEDSMSLLSIQICLCQRRRRIVIMVTNWTFSCDINIRIHLATCTYVGSSLPFSGLVFSQSYKPIVDIHYTVVTRFVWAISHLRCDHIRQLIFTSTLHKVLPCCSLDKPPGQKSNPTQVNRLFVAFVNSQFLTNGRGGEVDSNVLLSPQSGAS